ncbi:MAG TPA: hypothetical protein VL547_12365 [Dinghuibacter sp.]|jgi:hypothetical protein|uniref:hypothetical protein n=1 Tax=Dinghuibacter sp. TaxID=2024697 RepID=UPI002C065F4F|nr:hypothetical protein [Dinghuibacter sp.]HTJ12819.1 hypothetical protein [Dinghuibacter sp.]
MKIWFTLIALAALTGLRAQDTTHPVRVVYVVRPNQYVGALTKIRVEVNGQVVSMPNATYTDLRLRADSVTVRIENRRLSGESVLPLVSFKDTSYFVVFPEVHAHKKDRLIVTEVDKEGYNRYADKITRHVP